jgi:hypothetical protein
MPRDYKRIERILPGDLVCDFDPRTQKGVSALVISVVEGAGKEKNVHFLILGDDFLHDGVTDREKYYLISRSENSTA